MAEWVISVGGAITLLAALYKWAWHGGRDKAGNRQPGAVKGVFLTIRNVNDAILGREAIMDPETGNELAPAKPGIGTRMANTESTLTVLTEAVAKIADSHERIAGLERRLTVVETTVGIERTLKQVESIELLRTMDSAINADPERHLRSESRDTSDDDSAG